MSAPTDRIRVPILVTARSKPLPHRHREPVSLGVPFARGHVPDARHLGLEGPDGRHHPLQVRVLDRWPDHSARWVLVHFQTEHDGDSSGSYLLHVGAPPGPEVPDPLVVSHTADGVTIAVSGTRMAITAGGGFPLSSATDAAGTTLALGRFRMEHGGHSNEWRVADVAVVESGPLRTELLVRAVAHGTSHVLPVDVRARITVFAGTPVAKIDVELHNPRRAAHPEGQWPLGDPGSIQIESASVCFTTASVTSCLGSIHPDAPVEALTLPVEIRQVSSGGEHWNARTHVNHEGRVTLPCRGYRMTTGAGEQAGYRASPTVTAGPESAPISLTIPHFWQAFPYAIAVDAGALTVGLLPADSGGLHELQGGERLTRTFFAAFGPDAVSEVPLSWCHSPTRVFPSPEHVSATEALPCFVPADADPHPAYLSLVATSLDGDRGFLAKREAADEFGWRHFGDLPADHESAFQPADRPFISHYNNQYDAVAGFAIHFLRTGDERWWYLMDDLARHVRDIDIYRTSEDKAAYNGGLFWHTNHYVDAGTSTHRTYPPGGTSGGGPSAEHNYNYGLMLHYFLTGEEDSRETAVDLGDWVLRMDDGRRTPFRWLSRGPTGLASASGPGAYQGPGRGAGHSILACLVAHQLTGNAVYLSKAEELIQRCVHPVERVPSLYVEDIEGYWSYTAFLQVTGLYLHHKQTLHEYDAAFFYARESLLNHARWMCEHERPYLDRREKLEYPTETWVAQDIRKADVFMWAALHAAGNERATFTERALWFFEYVLTELPRMPGHWFARPLVLVLTQGYRIGWFAHHLQKAPSPGPVETPAAAFPPPAVFRPQKALAKNRAMMLAAAMAASTTAVVLWWWVL